MDKYSITLSDGTRWTYAPRGEDNIGHWVSSGGRRLTQLNCRTPADFRACADVVERWERDHAPKMRRRVVQDNEGRFWARHERLAGFVWHPYSASSARKVAAQQSYCDITDERIDICARLAAQPEEEYTDDE
jgi:hypothetical protein